jgi:hypothetical protein
MPPAPNRSDVTGNERVHTYKFPSVDRPFFSWNRPPFQNGTLECLIWLRKKFQRSVAPRHQSCSATKRLQRLLNQKENGHFVEYLLRGAGLRDMASRWMAE